uniref:Uncharacterized protein n=1 Tax=Solanum tuberosum TaxID=4113 RepID=M1BEM9_SOLTU
MGGKGSEKKPLEKGSFRNSNSKNLSPFKLDILSLKFWPFPEEERVGGRLGSIPMSLVSNVARSHSPKDGFLLEMALEQYCSSSTELPFAAVYLFFERWGCYCFDVGVFWTFWI